DLANGSRAAVQMDRDDRLGPRPDRIFQASRIEVAGALIDIDEDGSRTGRRHGGCRSDERVRGCDDLVSRPHAVRAEHQLDGRGARSDAKGVPDTTVVGEPPLELFELRPADECGSADHGGNGGVDPGLHLLVLLAQRDEANGGRDRFRRYHRSPVRTALYAAAHSSAVCRTAYCVVTVSLAQAHISQSA